LFQVPDQLRAVDVLCLKLIERTANFAGVVDLSLDWHFMIELLTYGRRKRPDFALVAGTEHLVSAAAIGATAMFAPLAGIAPRLVRELYDLCRKDRLADARVAQEAIAALRHLLQAGGAGSLKAALSAMGRDCGVPRPPLQALDAANAARLAADLAAIAALRGEPRGW